MKPTSAPALLTLAAVLAALSTACVAGSVTPDQRAETPPADLYANDTARNDGFRPDPAFVPDPVSTPPFALSRSALSVDSDVIVLEGDAQTVSTAGRSYGITEENANAIIRAVLAEHPDDFDTIQIYLTFRDAAQQGAAYYRGIRNDIQGIGQDVFDLRTTIGLPKGGRLSGFSNMNDMALFGSFRQLTTPKGPYYAVIAQELSHRWLMNLRFMDGGTVSDDLKGRQDAHWSALVHAYGSVQDGISWIDNGDGTFTHDGESNLGFAPLDRYAMGILPPEAVEPTFLIGGATANGRALTKTSHSDLARGMRVRGTRVPVTIDQVVSALGPRNPPAGTETPYSRVAFVLVTAPGQARAEWEPYLDVLKEVQRTFPETWRAWTGGAGAICTKIATRCPEPVIGLESYRVIDGNDGNIAPGESFELAVALRNDGLGSAEGVQVRVEPLGTGVEVEGDAVESPAIAERGQVDLPARFRLRVPSDMACGSFARVRVRSETREGPVFSELVELPVGTRTVMFDPLDEAPDWRVNPDGTDTARAGAWDLGQVELIAAAGVVTQPPEDHSPGESKLSFQTGARKGAFFADHDLDGGMTTLQSPVFPMKDLKDPSLVFYAWHVATDLSKPKREPVPGASLVVLGSDDGGLTWKEMARVDDETKAWERVVVRIRDTLALTNQVRFRFQISDDSPSGTVEAGIDDVSIIDVLDGCAVPKDRPEVVAMPETASERGGGCTDTRGGGGLEGAALVLSLVAWTRALGRRRA